MLLPFRFQFRRVKAYALADSQPGHRRNDFAPDEMKEGAVFYFQHVDNLSGKAIYRMHIAEVSSNRIVYDVENVSTMHNLLMPMLRPGEIQLFILWESEDGHHGEIGNAQEFRHNPADSLGSFGQWQFRIRHRRRHELYEQHDSRAGRDVCDRRKLQADFNGLKERQRQDF